MSPHDPYVERHLLETVEKTAAREPEKPWFSVAKPGADQGEEWKDISYGQMANAINRGARYLVDLLKEDVNSGATFAYVGPNDTRYITLFFASLKAGYRLFLVSPRNTVEGQNSLFEKTETKALLYAKGLEHLLSLESLSVPSYLVPEEDDLLAPAVAEIFPTQKVEDYEKLAMEPCLVLHTSGSTGIPKPVILKHGNYMAFDRSQHLKSGLHNRQVFAQLYTTCSRLFSTFPLFHAGGIMHALQFSVFGDFVLVFFPPGRPVTNETVKSCLKATACDVAALPPAVLEDMSCDPESVGLLSKLKWTVTGGGPTSQETADRLTSSNVHLINIVAATETVPLALCVTTPEEFPMFLPAEHSISGFDWRPLSGAGDNNLFELWIKRLPDWRSQGVFYTFPDIDEYNTRDVFRKVPGKEGYWTYYGRSDDVIVFSNGEKLNPVDIEGAVTASPNFKGALVTGQARFQAALFAEPSQHPTSEEEQAKLLDELWSIVEIKNKATVTHGKISRDLIRLTNPEKPFPRAGKGTIQRGLANQLYAAEIEDLYISQEKNNESSVPQLSLESEDAFGKSVLDLFTTVLALESVHLEPDTDLIKVGVDSMQVITVSRQLNASLKTLPQDIGGIKPRDIYAAPTPRGLAHFLYSKITSTGKDSVVGHESASAGDAGEDDEEPKQLLAKYTRDLPSAKFSASHDQSQETYIITGTTGSLGPYLLDQTLAESPRHIYAFNRDPNAATRQLTAHESLGLRTQFDKVEFLTVDLSKPNFGISPEALASIKTNVTKIIHNAWPVNFNMALSSFEASIAGVRNLIELIADSKQNPHLTFVSSIGTIALAPSPVEEDVHPLKAATLGYGQSKAIASMMLDEARAKGIQSAIVRVGQIAGPLHRLGAWNKREWFPTMIASSAGMGVMPIRIGSFQTRIDWLPIETVASSIVDICKSSGSGYFHSVNPSATSYDKLLPTIQSYFGDRVRAVDEDEWIAELEKISLKVHDRKEIERVPGIKLLDFYKGMLGTSTPSHVLETTRAEAVSASLRTVGPVQPAWIENWLQQWQF